MGWVFAIIYGGMVAWMVHLATGREPRYPALPDIAAGAVAGCVGYWLFALRLGFHERGAIGNVSIAGWAWAALASLVVSLLIAATAKARQVR